MERRLAAILAADLVGYARLIRADEDGTLAAFKALRASLIDPVLGGHGGRIVKVMGDGILVVFPSVVDAMEAAVETQRGLARRNSGLPEAARLRFRMGINLGDVVIDGDDIQGDGVNLAARLEGLAAPGAICLSAAVHDQVKHRLQLAFEDLGPRQVKNIAEPLRVWQWHPDSDRSDAGPAPVAAPLALPDKPSIAVLPFTNLSSDPEQAFFAEGISEDIITELSKFRSLFVIARNSSFSFQGRPADVKTLSAKLGVRYIVEGSVRRAAKRLRITAQLIDAVADAHLWAERYDRDLDDLFAVQDEVTLAIVTAIEPTLASAERERALRKPTESLDAWEAYQRGMWHSYRFTAADNAEAQVLFRRAVAGDGTFAPGHAGLAYALYLSVMLGFSGEVEAAMAEAVASAERAVALDGEDALGQATLGRVKLMMGAHGGAISAF